MKNQTIADLISWVDDKPRGLGKRGWMAFPGFHLQAYMRHTLRFLDGARRETIEVGSIEVPAEHQRQGNFSMWLTEVERIAHQRSVYVMVESVLNQHLAKTLKKRGYVQTPGSVPPSFYLKPVS